MATFSSRVAQPSLPAGHHNRRALKSLMLLFAACSVDLQAQSVSVTGPTQVRLGSTAQYNAVVRGVSNPAIVWSVNGFVNGNSATGSISASGLYSPASTIFAGHSITIGAAV